MARDDSLESDSNTVTIQEGFTESASDLQLAQSEGDSLQKKRKGRRQLLVFIGLQLALFLAALDGTIVSTALPTIGSFFNRMDIASWVATAYILTYNAFQPLFSKLSDIFGRKIIISIGIVIFLIGSILCGTAQNMVWLIVARAITGIGAAAIYSMVFIIVSDLVSLEKRGNYQGLITAVYALSSVFGPLIGGAFTDRVSWRWNFFINLPVGAIAMVLIFVYLRNDASKDSVTEKMKRVDYIGSTIVLTSTTLFLLAMNFGGQEFPWNSPAVIVPLIFVVIFIIVLTWVELKHAKEPLIPPRLFKNQSVIGILGNNWFFGMVFFSLLYYLPVYFQVTRGDSAIWSGIRLIPMQLTVTIVSTLTGLTITRWRKYRPFLLVGISLLVLSIGIFSLFDINTSWSMIYGITCLAGVGFGMLFSSSIIALQASAEPRDMGVVTGLGNFVRILGGALGVAISSAILNSSLLSELPQQLPAQYVQAAIQSSEFVRHDLPPQYVNYVLSCYIHALRLNWYVMTLMAGLGLCCSFFIKHTNLKNKKQSQAPPAGPQETIKIMEVPERAE